jgi:hypothetical protein
MLLNEILDRLTPPENERQNGTGSHRDFEYHWKTKSGNSVTLSFLLYKPNAAEIMFEVNYDTLETGRELDKDILSSVFYKIGEFIKAHDITEVKFEPVDDVNDYKGYAPHIAVIKDFVENNAVPARQKGLIRDLSMLISDKKINQNYMNYIKLRASSAFDDEHRLKFVALLDQLEDMDHSSMGGQNRRKRLYLYAIKKYLPDWTVKQQSSYIYAYKEY